MTDHLTAAPPTCAYCPTEIVLPGSGEYLGSDGRVTCDDCYCGICGNGHPDATTRADCAADADELDRDPADPQTWGVDPDAHHDHTEDM